MLAALVAVALVAMPAESAAERTKATGPTITSFSPRKGAVGTGVKIMVSGLEDATQVAFNGTPALSFTVDSAQQITAVVASGTTTGTISITTPGGTTTSKQVFIVTAGGKQLWKARYNGPGKAFDNPQAAVSSPDGSTVYVAGEDWTGRDWEFRTIAYDASKGRQRWKSGYNGGLPGPGASAVALSPDGTRLVVGGDWQFGSAMVVYDAATGQELWSTSSAADASLPHRTTAVAVSQDGATVFLTGYILHSDPNSDYDTVAFDAATGARLWTASYDGPDHSEDRPSALAVSGDGTKVFVTGRSFGNAFDYATVAYDTATGSQLWVARYDGSAGAFFPDDEAAAMAASPDGTKVFVTGRSCDPTCTYFDYATVAYDTANGAQLWASRYHGPLGDDMVRAMVVTPDGSRVVVTGSSAGNEYPSAVTIAYSATTGDSLWGNRATPDVAAYGNSIGVSPDGTKIFIAGSRVAPTAVHDEIAAAAYDTLTGNTLWAKHYADSPKAYDQATAQAVAGDGSKVFVTGFASGSDPDSRNWLTIAYSS